MWVQVINNNLTTPVTVDFTEADITSCEYRIMTNGRGLISVTKNNYDSANSLENKLIPDIRAKSNLDVLLYSGTTLLKMLKGSIGGYVLQSDGGRILERIEINIDLDDANGNQPVVNVQSNPAPTITTTEYKPAEKKLSIYSNHLNHDGNHDFQEHVELVTVYGVTLSKDSKTQAIDHPQWDIFLSDADKKAIDDAIKSKANAVLSVKKGWNGPDSTDIDGIAVKVL